MAGPVLPRIRAPYSRTDDEAIENLKSLPPSEWAHLVEDLLGWTESMAWPVFAGCCDLIVRNHEAAIEPLTRAFRCDDDEWHRNLLDELIPNLPLETRLKLRGCLIEYRDGGLCEKDCVEYEDCIELVEGILRDMGQEERRLRR